MAAFILPNFFTEAEILGHCANSTLDETARWRIGNGRLIQLSRVNAGLA
jgi:hypothetical protein